MAQKHKLLYFIMYFVSGLCGVVGKLEEGHEMLLLASSPHCCLKKRWSCSPLVLPAWWDPQRLQETCQSCRLHLITLLPAESEYDNMQLRGRVCTQSSEVGVPQHYHQERQVHFEILRYISVCLLVLQSNHWIASKMITFLNTLSLKLVAKW